MPQDANPQPNHRPEAGRPRTRAALDFGTDRASAFAKARRHTILVRTLRFALPASGLFMVAAYALFMQRSITLTWANKKVEVTAISISQEALVAHNPRYTGFDKQGGEFEVRAATAQQDHKMKGIVRLNKIEGKLIDGSRQMTTLKSPRGTLDSNSNVLELYERVDVASQNGMTAELTQATIYTKENRIVSDEPVTVRMPSGTVHGKAMTIEQKKKQVLFTGGVVAHLQAPPKPGEAEAAPGQALRGSQAQPAAKAPAAKPPEAKPPEAKTNAPVDVTSQRLLIDDAGKIATFFGDVVAKQVDQVMETAELQVFYEGQAEGGAKPQSSLAAGDGSGKLKRLVSRTDVVLTRGAERATGSAMDFDAINDRAVLAGPVAISGGPERGATADRAEIDNKTDIILLTGNVVVTQQKNVLKGRRLLADRKQGTLNLTSPAGPGQAKGQISARLHQNQAEADSPAAKKAAPKAAVAGFGLAARGDPGQPIDIDADTLDVDDKKKVAVFKGKVKAVQGDYVINTEEMTAHYTGEGGMALAGPAAGSAPAAGQAKQGAQLTHVVMPRRIDIVAKDGQRAQGNSAVFNPKTNSAKLTGDVVLSNGTSVTNGNCAELDMTTGLMKIIDACGFSSGASKGSVSATGNVIVKGRAQAVFVPGMLKEEQKKMKDAVGAAQPASAPGAPAASPAPSAAPAPAPVPRQPRPRSSGSDLQSVFGNNN